MTLKTVSKDFIFFITYEWDHYAVVFVPGRSFLLNVLHHYHIALIRKLSRK
jgi:hypothetical protein